MPEFQRGLTRRRPPVKKSNKSDHLVGNYVRTRAAVAREAAAAAANAAGDPPRTRLAVKKEKQKVTTTAKKKKVPVIVISERLSKSEERKVEVQDMLGGDSGGLSANKATGQDDDNNKSPFPDKVIAF